MKSPILLTVSACLAYLLFSGYSTGPAFVEGINCTGSFGSQTSCSGGNCHGGSDANTVVDVTIKDIATGTEIMDGRYTPNNTYRVIVSGRASGDFPVFSYQFSASSNSGFNGNGGYFLTGSGVHAVVAGQAEVVEPSNPKNTTNQSGMRYFADSFFWQSPPYGAGEWKIFITGMLANDDASRFGDKNNNYQRSYYPIPAAVNDFGDELTTLIYPNPVRQILNLQLNGAVHGDYHLFVTNSNGQVVYNASRAVNATEERVEIRPDWPAGLYHLRIEKDGKQRTLPFVKL